MSTFEGKILEIPYISIDRFNGENLKSEMYFLSHCHKDHMEGLEDSAFHYRLIKENKFLYLSDISYRIVKELYPLIEKQLKILDPYSTNILKIKENFLSVDIISAGHCPGSVMFLFQNGKTILYTGDYRINSKDLRKIKAFYFSSGELKKIDKIYLDTTFFLKRYRQFPNRDESLKTICDVIENWFSRSPDNIIKLITPAKYGYEFAFMEIYNKFKMPIHVNNEKYNFYSIIPEMDKTVTRNAKNTKIHCSCGSNYKWICQKDSENVKSIKISALRWTNDETDSGFEYGGSNEHFVCFSCHASYEESLEFLKFLKPKDIHPCVMHPELDKNQEIKNNIKEFLNSSNKENEITLFKIDAEVNDEEKIEDVEDYGILDSPPLKRRC